MLQGVNTETAQSADAEKQKKLQRFHIATRQNLFREKKLQQSIPDLRSAINVRAATDILKMLSAEKRLKVI